MRSKRTGSVEALDRERPMSWEGELSDQEASQMEHETGRASSPGQQVALTGGRPLKTEPDAEDEEDDEHDMDGVQSVGPASPQPMCTGASEEAVSMPPPSSLALGHHQHAAAADAVKSETVWSGPLETAAVKADPVRPALAASGSGSGPQQRPSFGEAFAGQTPLASPLTSRHPIRLPLTATG